MTAFVDEHRGVYGVELETLSWVEWFNSRRLLGPIGSIPPAEFEATYDQQAASTAKLAGLKQSTLRSPGRFTL